MEEQEVDVDMDLEPAYEVDRILKWREVKKGRRTPREFLVTWTRYPLDEAQWISETNFTYPALLKQQLKEDRPREEK